LKLFSRFTTYPYLGDYGSDLSTKATGLRLTETGYGSIIKTKFKSNIPTSTTVLLLFPSLWFPPYLDLKFLKIMWYTNKINIKLNILQKPWIEMVGMIKNIWFFSISQYILYITLYSNKLEWQWYLNAQPGLFYCCCWNFII